MPPSIVASVRQTILQNLKMAGALTVAELAQRLGVTPSAVRQQIASLETDGLLEFEDEKGRRGRPQRHYRLSAAGDEQFTRTYAGLAESLLEAVRTHLGTEALDAAFTGRREQMEAELAPLLRAEDLRGRIAQFVQAMAERGYMPTVTEDEQELAFAWHNCPVARIARQFSQPCSHEIRLIERLLGVPVVRESCIARGDTACRYRVALGEGSNGRPESEGCSVAIELGEGAPAKK
jgi:predicted ArsR family transcriptional regulator